MNLQLFGKDPLSFWNKLSKAPTDTLLKKLHFLALDAIIILQ